MPHKTSLLDEVYKFLRRQRTWFEFEKERDSIECSTRENGDVGYEKPGREDIREAKRLAKELVKKFGKGVLRLELDCIDEWTQLSISEKGRRFAAVSKRELLELAKDCFYNGTPPPDGSPWNGRLPAEDLRDSVMGLEIVKVQKKSLKDNRFLFKGVFQTATKGGDSGVYTDSILMGRFKKHYGKDGAAAMAAVFKGAASKVMSKVAKKLNRHPNLGRMLLDRITPEGTYHGDWTAISFKVTSIVPDKDVKIGRWEFTLGFKAWFEVIGEKQPEVTDTPFTDMSDRELDQWVEAFASYAPENYYMDGEFGGTERQLRQHWRNHFRQLKPRQQKQKMERMQRYMRASVRVASQWLRSFVRGVLCPKV